VQCEKGGVSNLAGCPAGSGISGQGPVYAARVAELHKAQETLATDKAHQRADQAQLVAAEAMSIGGPSSAAKAVTATAPRKYVICRALT
jgi:peroxiredoxin